MQLRRVGVLLSCALVACASTQTLHPGEEPAEEVFSSFEEGCEDERSLVLVCAEEDCGFFQCRDTLPEAIVPARGGGGFITPPAAPGGSPRRWWRNWPWLRRDSRPVLTFRLRASLDPKPQIPLLPSGRYVRHHIFPRARDLAEWFRERGVEIHNFSMVIPEHVHRRIHREGERGGLWNNAWRQFKNANENATREEIYRQAGKMIYEFELTGPVVPYYSGRRG
jgi:uncharacterized lipoprotein (TIGR02269 family)